MNAGRFHTALYIIQGETEDYADHSFAYIPDGKGPCQSLPQLARNYHLQIDQILFYPCQFLRYSLLQQRKTPSSQ